MMKKIYTKPRSLVVVVETFSHVLAGSGGGSITNIAGGSDGNQNSETTNNGSGDDNDEWKQHSKGFTAWDTWDD